VFSDVHCGASLEYPIQRLFQKMNVLQDKLDDAIDILDDEYTLDDLTSKAKTFGFKSSSEGSFTFLIASSHVDHHLQVRLFNTSTILWRI